MKIIRVACLSFLALLAACGDSNKLLGTWKNEPFKADFGMGTGVTYPETEISFEEKRMILVDQVWPVIQYQTSSERVELTLEGGRKYHFNFVNDDVFTTDMEMFKTTKFHRVK